jgi:hypothetical protein
MKKITSVTCFKNFIIEGFSYLLIEFVDMIMPEWLYYIINHWLSGRTMMDSLAEQKPGIESGVDPRKRIRTHSVVKSSGVAFDFNPN